MRLPLLHRNMQQEDFERVKNRDTIMSAYISEFSGIVRAAAEPWQPGDSVKAAITRASRRLGISARRVTTLWYQQRCAVLAHEADALRRWYAEHVASERARLVERLAEIERTQARIQGELNGVGMAGGEPHGFRGGEACTVDRRAGGRRG